MFKLRYTSTLITLLASSSLFASTIPAEHAFTSGDPVIQDYHQNDLGKQNTGLRLTSMGQFYDANERPFSVWRIRNSSDFAQTVTLSAYQSDWEAQYNVSANAEYFVASPQSSHTHQLFINSQTLDTKAPGSQVYVMPEVQSTLPSNTVMHLANPVLPDYLPSSDEVNTAEHYPEKTLSIAFSTGDDVQSRQTIYEQGGSWRGINIVIDNNTLLLNAWSIEGDVVWGYKSLSAGIQPNSAYTATLTLTANESYTGSLTGYVNGESIGKLSSVGPLLAHANGIGLGETNDTTVFNGKVDASANTFYGTITSVVQYNSALQSQDIVALNQHQASTLPTPLGNAGESEAPQSLLSNEVFARGLEAWRKPDVIFEGAACANCHSPDGFDLAYFDFSRDDIIRRAAPHLDSEEDMRAIADMIEYVRDYYGIAAPKDPRTFRPFQPGGGVLPGQDRFARDKALGEYFKARGFRFANTPVLSLEEARTQRDEWKQLDVRDIPIGIELPLWSLDGFHGEQQMSLNDWLPSLPRLPKAETLNQWYALQDAYIANPSDENFYNYYNAIDKDRIFLTRKENNLQLTEQPFTGSGNWLSSSKFKSVQFASHLFRQEYIDGAQTRETRPITGFALTAENKIHKPGAVSNPMWTVGDFFRVKDGDSEIQMPTQAPFPEGLADTYLPYNQEAEKAKVEWFMLGWLFDPALTKTCCGNPAKTGEYFHDALSRSKEIGALVTELGRAPNTSFPLHNTYIFTKKTIDKNYAPYAINQIERYGCDLDDCNQADSFNISSSNFFGYKKHVKNIPSATEHPAQREMYILNTLNTIRMLFYLAEERMDNNQGINHSRVLAKLNEASAFFGATADENPHYAHDIALKQRVIAKLNEALL